MSALTTIKLEKPVLGKNRSGDIGLDPPSRDIMRAPSVKSRKKNYVRRLWAWSSLSIISTELSALAMELDFKLAFFKVNLRR